MALGVVGFEAENENVPFRGERNEFVDRNFTIFAPEHIGLETIMSFRAFLCSGVGKGLTIVLRIAKDPCMHIINTGALEGLAQSSLRETFLATYRSEPYVYDCADVALLNDAQQILKTLTLIAPADDLFHRH